jgi:hypothetical protein
MVGDAVAAGSVGLVYVYSTNGAAELDAGRAFIFGLATDCVVEDEDSICSRSVRWSGLFGVYKESTVLTRL